MAKMVPDKFDIGNTPPGEREIFTRLQKDPSTSDWIVLHSLHLSKHESQTEGEIDFVIVIPHCGILCVEVKSHRSISFESGQWKMGSTIETRGPFKQASMAMHSLRKFLIEENEEFKKIPFCSCVIFTECKFSKLSTEWHDWQIIDSTKLWSGTPISSLIKSVISKSRDHNSSKANMGWLKHTKQPYLEQCEEILSILRGNFEIFPDPKRISDRRKDELKRFTEEQYVALDLMSENKRIVFKGLAGTGKTFLAIESANRAATEKKKCLFLCYNKKLFSFLKDSVAENHFLTIKSIKSLLLDFAKDKSSEIESWDEKLVTKALEEIIASGAFGIYDTIIMDEAQDFLFGDTVSVLDALLKGGLSAGEWQAYGDFHGQNIFGIPAKQIFEQLEKTCNNSYVTCRLDKNCRNLEKIGIFAQVMAEINPGYGSFLRTTDGFLPQRYLYKSFEEQKKQLLDILKTCELEGFKKEEIVVLSPITNSLAQNMKDDGFEFKEWNSSKLSKYVQFSTIQSFKGLESTVIILTDMVIQGEFDKTLAYIGCTRATDRLYILMKN